MQKVSLRNECWRSDCIFCSGEIQLFGDYHRMCSCLWFAPSLVRMIKRTLTPQFAFPFLMKGAPWWMPVITGISFWTLALLEGVARRLVFLSCKPRTFRAAFTPGLPRLFSWSSFIPQLSLREHSPVVVHCSQSALFLLPSLLDLHLAEGAPEAGFKSGFCFLEKCFSRFFSSRYQTGEQYLECTQTAMALAVLTIEADGNLKFLEN